MGGVKSSQHLLGKATDLDLKKPSDSDIDRLKRIFTGVIIYDKFVHVDSRANKIYLDKRTKNENETK